MERSVDALSNTDVGHGPLVLLSTGCGGAVHRDVGPQVPVNYRNGQGAEFP